VEVVRSPFIPGPHCVGGQASWHTIQALLDRLDTIDNFEHLPLAAFGPQVILERHMPVPASVVDPAAWVQQFVLPAIPEHPNDERDAGRHTRRDTTGNLFFRTNRVKQFVRSRFNGRSLGLDRHVAPSVTHYVPGKKEILLLEPMIATRVDFEKDLEHVSMVFHAWRSIFGAAHAKREPHFIAYVFSNGMRGVVAEAQKTLRVARAHVVDVDVPSERARFIEQIKRVGRTGPHQGELH
jgi:hypothetical protein